jgi:hypothetical protein
VAPFSWSIVAGNLPSGLQLDGAAGVISGTVTTLATRVRPASAATTAMPQPLDATTASFTVQMIDSGSPPLTVTQNLSLNINPAAVPVAPTITTQPTNQTVSVGQTATFTVVASGSSLHYQWQKGGVDISGATAASFTTPAAAPTDNGAQYRVIVSNSSGTVTSNAVSLIVRSVGGVSVRPTAINLLLTQGNHGQFFATVPSGNVTWQVARNGVACTAPADCGSVSPAVTASGQPTTYTAPTNPLALNGTSVNVVATSTNDPAAFANGGVGIKPCDPFSDAWCGQFTIFVQGFNTANSTRATAAGSFTATGLANGPNGVTGGVIDIFDSDGADAGTAINSGSYTFNPDTFSGTVTLRTASAIASHAQRTYAVQRPFLVGPPTSLIAFEPTASPAAAFQGSGFIEALGTQAGSSIPTLSTTATALAYVLQLDGTGPSGRVGIVGAVKLNVVPDPNQPTLKVCSTVSSGPTDVVRNQSGIFIGSLTGTCTAADPTTGRGTMDLSFSSSAPVSFAYYIDSLGTLALVSTSTNLSGVAQVQGGTSAPPKQWIACSQPDCVALTSGVNGGALALSMGLLTHVGLGTLTTGAQTGDLSTSLDLVSAGSFTSTAAAGSYNIDTASGVGLICLHAQPCPANPTITDTNALTVAFSELDTGFLLANDATVGLGKLHSQRLAGANQPLQNPPGVFAGGTILSGLPIVPNVSGLFTPSQPSGAGNLPSTLDIDSVSIAGSPLAQRSVAASYTFDGPTVTGRATGTGAAPGPTAFVFYVMDSTDVVLMRTDNDVANGQEILELHGGCNGCFQAFAIPQSLAMIAGGSTITSVTVAMSGPSASTGTVTFALSNPPANIGVSFNPATVAIDPVTGTGTTIMTLTALPGVTLNTNLQLTVTATATGGRMASANASVVVGP